jgi:BlaI family transcriptional regulator, penicillinase repressor
MAQKELTKAEEQVMQFIWKMERGFLKDIVESFPNPRPATTTVSTVVRILVAKKFVGYKTYGKSNEYYALISKGEYFNRKLKPIVANYFNGSIANVTSFFASAQLNLAELEEVKKLIDQKIKSLKAK